MAFLTTTVPSIWYTIHLLVTLVRIKPKSDDSLSVIIGVMDGNDLDLAIQYPTDLTHTSVTNNWILCQIEGAVVVRKAM